MLRLVSSVQSQGYSLMEPLDGCLELNAQPPSTGETSKPSQNQSSKKYSNGTKNVGPLVTKEQTPPQDKPRFFYLLTYSMVQSPS